MYVISVMQKTKQPE